jgi:hypothetical protein
MTDVLDVLWHGLRDSLLMAWAVWWALVLGFAISAIVQAWVPRERIERLMSGAGARPVGCATALGAASSSCSYAAVAIAKSLFSEGSLGRFGRERPPGRGAVVDGISFAGGPGVPVRRPDRHPNLADLPQVLRHPVHGADNRLDCSSRWSQRP